MKRTLVAIEQGNSNTVAAVLIDGVWTRELRIATRRGRLAADYAVELANITGAGADCVISSVVPGELPALEGMCGMIGWQAQIVGRDLPTLIETRVAPGATVGVDRLLTALGARLVASGDLIVVDAGTATKVDHVSADGAFCGGMIAPGLHSTLDRLVKACAQLTPVEMSRPQRVIGRTTAEALASGAYYGYLALLEGLIQRTREGLDRPVTVVATGGVLAGLSDLAHFVDVYDPRLTLNGLAAAWRAASSALPRRPPPIRQDGLDRLAGRHSDEQPDPQNGLSTLERR